MRACCESATGSISGGKNLRHILHLGEFFSHFLLLD